MGSSRKDPHVQISLSPGQLIFIMILSIILFGATGVVAFNTEFEQAILVSHNTVMNDPFSAWIMQSTSSLGMPFISACYAILIYWSNRTGKTDEDCTLFFLIIVSFALTTLVGDILKEIIDRPRPASLLTGIIVQGEISGSPSMPSGHAAKSLALVLPFVILSKRREWGALLLKICLIVVALAVGYSRLALQKHFLSDVLAGAGLSMILLPVAVWLTNGFYRRRGIDRLRLTNLNKRLRIIFAAFTFILLLV